MKYRMLSGLIGPLLTISIFVPLCAPNATADEVYAYQGSDYTSVFNTLTPLGSTGASLEAYSMSDSISGDFTTSTPLGPNFSGDITPLTYSFGDGLLDWTNNNSVGHFYGTTDAYGTLISADVFLNSIELPGVWDYCAAPSLCGSVDGFLSIENEPGSPGNGDNVQLSYSVPFSSNLVPEFTMASNSTPGIWGPDFDPSGVPEPATFILMLTALMAVAFWGRRRITS